MTKASPLSRSGTIKALAYPLFFLALYTVIVKFMNPMIFFAVEGPTPTMQNPPIMWDFWWAIHLFLGFALLRREKFAWGLALGVSLVEIAIIVTKFWLFWQDPDINFWTLSWYVNKCFILSYFVCLLAFILLPKTRMELKKP